MSEFKSAGFSGEFGGGSEIVGVTTMVSPNYFVPPSGTTAERPSNPLPGMLRFNTDIGRLEIWRGDHWATIEGESVEMIGNHMTGSGESRSGTGVRGVFIGNRNTPTTPSSPKSEYITIATLGDAVTFGGLTQQVAMPGSFASSTRGVFFGGYNHPVAGARTASIRGFTFASTGSHVNFSSVISSITQQSKGMSNETRGICQHGQQFGPAVIVDTMEYVTIASIGDAVDFGNLTDASADGVTFGSSVRGIYAGGSLGGGGRNTIDYITISTQGNSTEFGDLTEVSQGGSSGGNATRGIRMGGLDPSAVNTIDFVQIASTGNAQDFGDMVHGVTRYGSQANISSPIRSIHAGGFQTSNEDAIQYVTNSTTGNSVDFGNLTESKYQFSGSSNGHGGL